MTIRNVSRPLPTIPIDQFKEACIVMAKAASQAELEIPKRTSKRQRYAIITMRILRGLNEAYSHNTPSPVIGSLLTRFMFMGSLTLSSKFSEWVDHSSGTPSVHENMIEVAASIHVQDTDLQFNHRLFLKMLKDKQS